MSLRLTSVSSHFYPIKESTNQSILRIRGAVVSRLTAGPGALGSGPGVIYNVVKCETFEIPVQGKYLSHHIIHDMTPHILRYDPDPTTFICLYTPLLIL